MTHILVNTVNSSISYSISSSMVELSMLHVQVSRVNSSLSYISSSVHGQCYLFKLVQSTVVYEQCSLSVLHVQVSRLSILQ